MYLFGHLGIGYAMIEGLPATRRLKLPVAPLLLGTVLPDLLDKTLYYGLSLLTGKHGYELGILAGTRNFGHTLIFFVSLAALAHFARSKPWLAVALGVLSHQLLDIISDIVITQNHSLDLHGFLWPLLGWYFPLIAFPSFSAQLNYWTQPFPIACETVGALVLAIAFAKNLRLKNRESLKSQNPSV